MPAPPDPADTPAPPIKVLLVAASPVEGIRKRTDLEFRKIVERCSAARHKIEFIVVPAATFHNLRTALLRHEPHILHISTQGMPDGSLFFEAEPDGRNQIISKVRLRRLLSALADNLKLVFFNAINSTIVARDIPPAIKWTIGLNATVPDDTAINFAVCFYEGLAFGRPIPTAYHSAEAELEDEGAELQLLGG